MDLEPDLEVVGEAANGAEAVEISVASRPDVALVDHEFAADSGGPDAVFRGWH